MNERTKLEYGLLGFIISENAPEQNEQIFSELQVEDFTSAGSQVVFRTLKQTFLESNAKRFELALVVDDLTNKVKEPEKLLASMIADAIFKVSVRESIDRIKTLAIKTKTKELFKNISSEVEQGKLKGSEAIEELTQQIDGINTNAIKELKTVGEVIDETMDNINKRMSGDQPEGYKTGFKGYDELTNGLQKGTLNIIAARPAMGKTAFAINLATNISKEKNVVFFSLEMPPHLLMERALSSESQVPSFKIKKGELDDTNLKIIRATSDDLRKRNLSFNSSYSIPFDELLLLIRKENRKKKLDMIVIDYLQLIEPPKRSKGNREQEVAKISRSLKSLSLELDIPIIALSQLSRGVEHRENKRPMMSDLRESGAIEQDADLIMFLYRDDYYNPPEDIVKISDVEIIVAKHRQGSTGKIDMDFDLTIGKFDNKTEGYENIVM